MLGQFEGHKIVTTTSYLAPIALEGEVVEIRIFKKSTLKLISAPIFIQEIFLPIESIFFFFLKLLCQRPPKLL